MQIEVERGNRTKHYLKRERMLPRLCRGGRKGWGEARIKRGRAHKVRVLPERKQVSWKGAVRPEGPAIPFHTVDLCSDLECSLPSFPVPRFPSGALDQGSFVGKER